MKLKLCPKACLTALFVKNSKNLKCAALAFGIILIVFLACYFVHKSRQTKFSKMLHAALNKSEITEAKKDLQIIYKSNFVPGGIKSVASLYYAALLLEEGKKSEALEVYQEISNCWFCHSYAKDLSGLLMVKALMSDEEELSKEDLSARIAKIEKSNDSLRYYIVEQRAFLEMQKGNLENSYSAFESIVKAADSSQWLKERAEKGMVIVVSKGFEPQKKVNESKDDANKDSSIGK